MFFGMLNPFLKFFLDRIISEASQGSESASEAAVYLKMATEAKKIKYHVFCGKESKYMFFGMPNPFLKI